MTGCSVWYLLLNKTEHTSRRTLLFRAERLLHGSHMAEQHHLVPTADKAIRVSLSRPWYVYVCFLARYYKTRGVREAWMSWQIHAAQRLTEVLENVKLYIKLGGGIQGNILTGAPKCLDMPLYRTSLRA